MPRTREPRRPRPSRAAGSVRAATRAPPSSWPARTSRRRSRPILKHLVEEQEFQWPESLDAVVELAQQRFRLAVNALAAAAQGPAQIGKQLLEGVELLVQLRPKLPVESEQTAAV